MIVTAIMVDHSAVLVLIFEEMMNNSANLDSNELMEDSEQQNSNATVAVAMKDVFHDWMQLCLPQQPRTTNHDGLEGRTRPSIQSISKEYFRSLTTTTSPSKAIALLIQILKPCFEKDTTTTTASSSSLSTDILEASSSITTKYLAISCLVGSIQGCCSRNSNASIRPTITTESSSLTTVEPVTIQFIQLICNFLLPHIGPIDLNEQQHNSYNDKDDNIEMNMILASTTGEGEDGELYDTEQLRDLAMNGFISILQLISCDASSSSSSSSSSSQLFTTTTATIDEWIQFICTITMKGVEYRCSHDDENNINDAELNDDMIYGFSTTTGEEQPKMNNRSTVEYGLALLPRIRRSLCFALLQNAVDTIRSVLSITSSSTPTTTAISVETAKLLVEYVQFIVRCLHGESDPRCLLQLLLLIYNTILEFYPHLCLCIESQREQEMKNKMISLTQTMISNIFDAVVPYYPIQFQPPPNDTIGITRQSLRAALINILSCTMYDSHIKRIDETNESTTMSFFTCELLLDCLAPSPNDEPLSIMEQIDLLEDLDNFLFHSFPKESEHRTHNENAYINLQHFNIVHQQGIADALIRIHEKSSLIVASSLSSSSKNATMNNDVILAKKLADSCRSVISKIATTMERLLTVGVKSKHTITTSKNKENKIGKDGAPWQVFVEEPINKVSTCLRQQEYKLYNDGATRIAIAYIACVASCGGSKTLQLCLQVGLVPLIQYLKRINPTTISNYDNSNDKETVVTNVYGIGAFFSSCRVSVDVAKKDGIYWHPHPLEPYSNDALEFLLNILVSSLENRKQNGSIQITVAALRTFGSILLVSPISLFAIDQVNRIIPFCEMLCQHIETTDATENPDGWSAAIGTAYSQTFGSLLGQALDSYTNDTLSDSNDDQLIIQSEPVQQYFVHSLFPTVLNSEANIDSTIRIYNRQLLARSSAYSTHAASHIVHNLAKTLHGAITSADNEKAEAAAASLAFLFEHENTCAPQAYHKLAYPNISSLDIFNAFLPITLSQQSSNMEIGISTLQLPTSLDDRKKSSAALMKAYKVVLHLRKGYEHNLSTSQFRKLIEWTDKVLPPLSELDTLKLSIVLPALSAAMENFESVQDIGNVFIGEKSLENTIYAMIGDLTEFSLSTEYHTTARLHAARCIHASIACFISRAVPNCPVEELIITKLQPAMHLVMTTIRDKSIEAQRTETALSSLLEMIDILAMLGSAAACRGGGPSSKSSNKIVLFLVDLACSKKSNLLPDNEKNQYIDLSDVDRDASTEISIQAARSIGSILATQNNASELWKQRVINIAIKRMLEYQTLGDEPYEFIGSLECLCHVLCGANLSSMVSSTQYSAMETLLCKGLSLPILQSADTSTIKVLLASILKVLSVKPACFRSVYPLVTGSLRAFATLDSSNDGIMCKILSMQLLAMVAQLSETDFAAMDVVKTIRPAVLALLGTATDHPSVVLRSAAVEVRNIWTVVLET